MSTETYTPYGVSGYDARQNTAEQELAEELTKTIAELSPADQDQLRRISATLAMSLSPLPEDEAEKMRKNLLGTISGGVQEYDGTSVRGLRRREDEFGNTKLLVNGKPMSELAIDHAYMFIEPSKQALDEIQEDLRRMTPVDWKDRTWNGIDTATYKYPIEPKKSLEKQRQDAIAREHSSREIEFGDIDYEWHKVQKDLPAHAKHTGEVVVPNMEPVFDDSYEATHTGLGVKMGEIAAHYLVVLKK